MRIFDQNGNELNPSDIDYNEGYLIYDSLFVRHHDAVPAVEEHGYFEGDEWIIEIPAVDEIPGWDEYETIMRYVPYEDPVDIDTSSNMTWDEVAQALAEGVEGI